MFVPQKPFPNPYNFPSSDDYYEALNEYNEWVENIENIEGEMIDLAYERNLEEKWEQES